MTSLENYASQISGLTFFSVPEENLEEYQANYKACLDRTCDGTLKWRPFYFLLAFRLLALLKFSPSATSSTNDSPAWGC